MTGTMDKLTRFPELSVQSMTEVRKSRVKRSGGSVPQDRPRGRELGRKMHVTGVLVDWGATGWKQKERYVK